MRGSTEVQFVAFVNHRPIWGIQYPELLKAFAKFGFEELRTTIKPPQLVQILQGIGESMTEEEAIKTLGVLMNLRPPLGDWETVGAERDHYNSKMTLPKELTVQQVIEEVLSLHTKDAFYGGTDQLNHWEHENPTEKNSKKAVFTLHCNDDSCSFVYSTHLKHTHAFWTSGHPFQTSTPSIHSMNLKRNIHAPYPFENFRIPWQRTVGGNDGEILWG